jgi:Na+/serine symporter
MVDHSNRQVSNQNEQKKKSRIPIFILIVVGIFLAAFVFYILADREPTTGTVPADTSIPATQDTSDTATATDNSPVDNTVNAVANDQE